VGSNLNSLEVMMAHRGSAMATIYFSSVLKAEYQEELEKIIFFSPNQNKVRADIVAAIKLIGKPCIVRHGETLRVSVGQYEDAQTLYALEEHLSHPRLLGSIIFIRDQYENLTVAHLAVVPDCIMTLDSADIPLAVRLFFHVMDIAKQVKGIETVTLMYGRGKSLKIRVSSVPIGPPVCIGRTFP